MLQTVQTVRLHCKQNRTLCTIGLWHNKEMNQEPKDRLKIARRDAGYNSPTDAAAAIRSINKNTLISNENGNRDISRKAAENYAIAFGVSAGWLLYGEGEKSATEMSIPVLSTISAGVLVSSPAQDDIKSVTRAIGLPDGDWIALKVSGTSMDRISPPDSIIFIDRRDKLLVLNGLYVIDDGEGNATYKRYRPDPARFEPVSTDPTHETIFPDNHPTVIGRVKRSMIDT